MYEMLLLAAKPLFYKTKNAILALASSSKIAIRVENHVLLLISDWSSSLVVISATTHHFIHHTGIGSVRSRAVKVKIIT